MPKYKKGQSGNPNGRPRGVPNVITRTFKALVQGELDQLGPEHLHQWASENPGQFYAIAAKLIPSELQASLTVSPPQKTYEEAKAELTKLYNEDLAALMVGDITEDQYLDRILNRKGCKLVPPLEAKPEKADITDINPTTR